MAFVTHAGIDGYTRRIVLLKMSTKDQVKTVLRKFGATVGELGLLAGVR